MFDITGCFCQCDKCGSSILCFSTNCFTLFQSKLNSFSEEIDLRVVTQARETTWASTAVTWLPCNFWLRLSVWERIKWANLWWSSKRIWVYTLWCHGCVLLSPNKNSFRVTNLTNFATHQSFWYSIQIIDTNGPSGMAKQFYGGGFKSVNKLGIFITATRVIFHLNEVQFSITFRRHFY